MSKDQDVHERMRRPSQTLEDLLKSGDLGPKRDIPPEEIFDMGEAMDRLGEEYARKLRDEEE